MQELAYVKREIPFTDSLTISEATGIQHNSVTRIIRNKRHLFEAFGTIEFMDLKSKNLKGGRPIKNYILNEPQATLLITFLDNNEKVDLFKKELVRQFFEMKNVLTEKKTTAWLESRQQGKLTRKSETDEIKHFVEYATAQGSGHADKYYIHFSKLADKTVGITDREIASTFQLNTLTLVERIILITIRQGITQGRNYKDIYQHCKQAVDNFGTSAYLGVSI